MTTTIVDEQMEKLYEQINEHYKTINRELVNKIVHRFSEIIDLFYDFAFSHINDEKEKEEIQKMKNYLLPKLILSNEDLPEASTFDVVFTIIHMVFSFMIKYDKRCYELFEFHYCDEFAWLRYDVKKFDMGWKHHYRFNDYNIPSTMERFFNISNKEIWHLLMLNYPNGNYNLARKWRDFDETTLPYPSFKNEGDPYCPGYEK